MKNLIITIAIAILTFSCNDEEPATQQQEEVILLIKQIRINGECDSLTYCKFEFKIDKDSVYTKKTNVDESSSLPVINKSYSISDNIIDTLVNFIDFNKIKSDNYISECNIVDEGCYEMYITTNFRVIYLKYGVLPEEFIKLNNYILMKRDSYDF